MVLLVLVTGRLVSTSTQSGFEPQRTMSEEQVSLGADAGVQYSTILLREVVFICANIGTWHAQACMHQMLKLACEQK